MSTTLTNLKTDRVFTCSSYTVSRKHIVLDGIHSIDGPISDYIVVIDGKYPVLTALQFYLAFSPFERIAIKNSTDLIVKEFWDTYQFTASQGSTIDPNLVSIVDGLSYLLTTNQEPAQALPWVTGADVIVGQKVAVGSNTYTCTTAGTTGTVALTGTEISITDGTVVWSYTPTPYIAAGRMAAIQAGIPQ